MKFNELLNAFHQAQHNLMVYMVEEIKKVAINPIIFYDNDIFVSIDSSDYDEFEEINFVRSVYVEDDVVWVSANLEYNFEDLKISEQICIFNEIKNNINL
jgi:hypothetical protein